MYFLLHRHHSKRVSTGAHACMLTDLSAEYYTTDFSCRLNHISHNCMTHTASSTENLSFYIFKKHFLIHCIHKTVSNSVDPLSELFKQISKDGGGKHMN